MLTINKDNALLANITSFASIATCFLLATSYIPPNLKEAATEDLFEIIIDCNAFKEAVILPN